MAGILTVLIIEASAEGVKKFKTKREAKKKAKLEVEEQAKREEYFTSNKAREAAEERRQAEEEEFEAAGEPGSSSVHPALRNGPREAPPPYIENAPSYDEHYSHQKAPDEVLQGQAVTAEEERELSPEEIEKLKKKRRQEYFRKGKYLSLVQKHSRGKSEGVPYPAAAGLAL